MILIILQVIFFVANSLNFDQLPAARIEGIDIRKFFPVELEARNMWASTKPEQSDTAPITNNNSVPHIPKAAVHCYDRNHYWPGPIDTDGTLGYDKKK